MLLLTFVSTRCVIKAEELLKAAAIGVQAVPLARDIEARCGIGLKVSDNDMERVRHVLKDIEYKEDEKF